VGVFGHDWSGIGLDGSADWVEYARQAEVYARGKIALTIPQCNDEEGTSHKPFQITASGAPCLHLFRPGIAGCFTPGIEIALFHTPHDAREQTEALINDPAARRDLSEAGHARFLQDHTWSVRLARMLDGVGIGTTTFGLAESVSSKSAVPGSPPSRSALPGSTATESPVCQT